MQIATIECNTVSMDRLHSCLCFSCRPGNLPVNPPTMTATNLGVTAAGPTTAAANVHEEIEPNNKTACFLGGAAVKSNTYSEGKSTTYDIVPPFRDL